ncbi:hypothetical protein ACHAWF_011882 [Thalassiosira exigua]
MPLAGGGGTVPGSGSDMRRGASDSSTVASASHKSTGSDAENIMGRGNGVSSSSSPRSPRSSRSSPRSPLSSGGGSGRPGVLDEGSSSPRGRAGIMGLEKRDSSKKLLAAVPPLEDRYVDGIEYEPPDGVPPAPRSADGFPPASPPADEEKEGEEGGPAWDRGEPAAGPPAARGDSAKDGESAEDHAEDASDVWSADESESTVPPAAARHPKIRIGRTGNPVGSVGYPLSVTALEREMEEVQEEDQADEEDEIAQLLQDEDEEDDVDDDISSDSAVTRHFPLEISMDNGGVSALLPSGQVLVGEANRENVLARLTPSLQDSSPGSSSESTKKSKKEGAGDADQGGNDDGGDDQPEEVQESPSLTRIQTSSSSMSEDLTFNSYAASDLSSMMSHLEIQQLLQQGRQQRGAPATTSSPRGERPTMVLYADRSLYVPPRGGEGGGGGDGGPPPAPRARPRPSSRPMSPRPGSPRTVSARPASPRPTPRPVSPPPLPLRSMPVSPRQTSSKSLESCPSASSSNHHLLHRADAMEGSIDETTDPGEVLPLPRDRSFDLHLVGRSLTLTTAASTVATAKSDPERRGEEDEEEAYRELRSAAPLLSPAPVRRSEAQSALGTGARSLADDLTLPHEEGDGDERGGESWSDGPGGGPAPLHWDAAAKRPRRPVPPPRAPAVGGDDGYSADLSSYTLEAANNIDECSNASSFGLELRTAPPVAVDSESYDDFDSREEDGRGGRRSPWGVPAARPIHRQGVAPPHHGFPSLMDTSISSFSALTGASTTTDGMSLAGRTITTTQTAKTAATRLDNLAGEEREDSLRRMITGDRPGVVDVGPKADGVSLAPSALLAGAPVDTRARSGVAARDPLTSVATTGAPLTDPDGFASFPVTGPPVADYDRHYIVDLERINEESSGHHDLSSGGKKLEGSIGSSPRPSQSIEASPKASRGREGASRAREGAVAPPHTQFYDYRHQYYMEQYHYCDERFSQSPRGGSGVDDDADSDCSSVTLSQAFRNSDDASESSLSTDDYQSQARSRAGSSMAESSHSPGYSLAGSTVSSVTLSRALSVERHEHSGGMYVATRLGDYVEVPNGPDADLASVDSVEEDDRLGGEGARGPVEKADDSTSGEGSGDGSGSDAPWDHHRGGTGDEDADAISDAAAAGSKTPPPAQLAQPADDVEADLISALVPECGVPIPSVMAKAGRKARSKGVLLPWHSTRSIQNYHGRRGKKKGSSSTHSSRSRERSIFSTASVHTFRG